ncbi:MAG: hypothetical protein NZ730_11940 [Porticoccaceae bacterium]|nr:hypothetical protein [Porticoccaceae bacterium]
MFATGDLVRVTDGWYLPHFSRKIGIIRGTVIDNTTDAGKPLFYQVFYADNGNHMILGSDLVLVSKAPKKENV